MPAYTRNDVRRALELERAIHRTLGELAAPASARDASAARIRALEALLKQAPDTEVVDVHY